MFARDLKILSQIVDKIAEKARTFESPQTQLFREKARSV